jgi:N-acetylglucosamine-6-sulfatase
LEGVGKTLLKTALVIFVVLASSSLTASTVREAPPSERPNILFILTDDLDARSARLMPRLEEFVAARGVTFKNAFVTTSQCCPSRASILTGKYAHNHTVYHNDPPEGGAPKFFSSDEHASTVATWLDEQDYETILIGKYLNYYDGTYVPPGWDEWRGQLGRNNDYEYNVNGTVRYRNPEKYHDTDVFSGWATDYVRRSAGEERPFFMYLALNAPHGPDDGAPRDEEEFSRARLPRPPSFAEEDVSDKPRWIRRLPPLNDADIKRLTESHRERLRSLSSADQMIERLIVELREAGELKNTYIFFTSDNGYHLGQHRLDKGKATAYEEDIRVPLYVRGPGVPAGRTLGHKVLNVDFAPTVAELGGTRAPAESDGRSFVPLLGATPPPAGSWRESFLVEFFKHHPYAALRTGKYTYVEYDDGARELYDLEADPYQLNSLHASPDHQALMETLHARLEKLKACSGRASCKAAEGGEKPEGSRGREG